MIEVRELLPGDIEIVWPQAAEIVARRFNGGGWSLDHFLHTPWGWAFCINGKPAALGGVFDYGNGIGNGWAMLSHVPARYAVKLCKVFRNKLSLTPFHWIDGQVNELDDKAMRFANIIGFRVLPGADQVVMDDLTLTRVVYRKGFMA